MSEIGAGLGVPACPDLMVACVQIEPIVGSKAGNLALSLVLIERAAVGGAKLIVLPELTSSGYVFSSRAEAFSVAESVAEGESVHTWCEAAQRPGIYVVAGFAER